MGNLPMTCETAIVIEPIGLQMSPPRMIFHNVNYRLIMGADVLAHVIYIKNDYIKYFTLGCCSRRTLITYWKWTTIIAFFIDTFHSAIFTNDNTGCVVPNTRRCWGIATISVSHLPFRIICAVATLTFSWTIFFKVFYTLISTYELYG